MSKVFLFRSRIRQEEFLQVSSKATCHFLMWQSDLSAGHIICIQAHLFVSGPKAVTEDVRCEHGRFCTEQMAGEEEKAGTPLPAIQTISIIKQLKDFEETWCFTQWNSTGERFTAQLSVEQLQLRLWRHRVSPILHCSHEASASSLLLQWTRALLLRWPQA